MFLKAKLSSRKFWLTVINTIFTISAFFIVDDWRLKAVALGCCTVGIGLYVLSEALTDMATIDNSVIHHVVYDEEEEAEESEETENDE